MTTPLGPVDAATVVIGYDLTVLVVGVLLIVWGYRTDRKQVPFDWSRYWRWWRVCTVFAVLGAFGVIPAAWLAFMGRPPHWVANAGAAGFAILVFAVPSLHWRLWAPIFGIGLPAREYLRQGFRSLGYALALSVVGTVAMIFLGNALIGR